jgi:hypothetical protein
MSTLSLVTMILVLSIVWGGFLFCLTLALRKEGEKKEAGGRRQEAGRGEG